MTNSLSRGPPAKENFLIVYSRDKILKKTWNYWERSVGNTS